MLLGSLPEKQRILEAIALAVAAVRTKRRDERAG
jgi:hypothetical protein